MGSPEFAAPSLQALVNAGARIVGVYTQPDRPGGRGRLLRASPVKQLAEGVGLPVFQPARLRQPDAIGELASLAPDLIVIAAYGQILRPAVLALPRYGTLNVHASLLPNYRGASPVVAAILDGVEETGVTIMLVDEGMDTGPIVAQEAVAIGSFDTAGALGERLALLGAELLQQVLPRWVAGEIEPQAQDDAQASVTRLVKKDDGVLNWQMPAIDLWRRVRAFTPWPGATTSLNGLALQIQQAWPLAGDKDTEPGTVVGVPALADLPPLLPRPAFAVQTGEGLLLPLVVQKAGRRPVTAAEFANGERGLIGSRFGG